MTTANHPAYGRRITRSMTEAAELPERLTSLLLIVVAALAVGFRVVPLFDPHDPWVDEAMLLANLPLPSLSAVFQPLPLFEQATTLGHLLLLDTLVSAFPDHVLFVSRLLSVVASLVGLVLFYLAVRRITSGSILVLAVLLASLSPGAVRYSLEIKHYIFEVAATSAILYASVLLCERINAMRIAIAALCGVLALVFSFTAPIVIAAFGTVLILRQMVVDRQLVSGAVVTLVALFAGLAAVFLVLYVGYTKPVTALQFAAYADRYGIDPSNLLTRSADPRIFLDILTYFFHPFSQLVPGRLQGLIPLNPWVLVFLPMIGLALAGAVVGLLGHMRHIIILSIILAICFLLALSLTGVFPARSSRHILFMQPLIALLITLGIWGVLSIIVRLPLGSMARSVPVATTAGALLLAAIVNVSRLDTLETQAVSPLLTEMEGSKAPVWIYWGAQPAVRVLASDHIQALGIIPHASSTAGWFRTKRGPDRTASEGYLEELRDDIAGLSEVWLLFSHHWAERDGLPRFWAVAEEAVGGCREVRRTAGAVLWHCGGPRP